MSEQMIGALVNATWQTLSMTTLACFIGMLFGIPMGALLQVTQKKHLTPCPLLHRSLSVLIDTMRSIPFIIFLVLLIPVTRLIVGTSIGTGAATVPLSLAAIPFVARLIDNALAQVPPGLIEAAQAMGASPLQIVIKVLLPESLNALVRAATLTWVTLVGYSAMAGAVGGGGLGQMAIDYGYERFNIRVMLYTVLLLVIYVQCIQRLGDYVVHLLIKIKS